MQHSKLHVAHLIFCEAYSEALFVFNAPTGQEHQLFWQR
jgi:hypothetical protein